MIKETSKNSKQKKIVVSSIVLAALTAVGGTFAWFTAQDEVTNKVSGVNNYNTSIVEDFTPPADLIPGQVINKDVYITNTGNVDAFVKVSLDNSLDLVKLTASTDSEYTEANASRYYELSTEKVEQSMPDTVGKSEDEVKSIQAGGTVVCKAGKTVDTQAEQIEKGTDYDPSTDESTGSSKNGLYVFQRAASMAKADSEITLRDGTVVPAGSTYRTYEYAGYWYQDGKYYAVDDLTVDNATNTFSAKMVMTEDLPGLTPSMDYSKVKSDNLIVATYGEGSEKYQMNIYLDSDWQTNWTFDEVNKTFFYNNTLKVSTTSPKFVDKIELDPSVSNDSYKKFDYYLDVIHKSAQITVSEDGQQMETAVTSDSDTWTLTPTVTRDSNGIITAVAWS